MADGVKKIQDAFADLFVGYPRRDKFVSTQAEEDFVRLWFRQFRVVPEDMAVAALTELLVRNPSNPYFPTITDFYDTVRRLMADSHNETD